MNHILNVENQIDELHSIFNKIRESNTILFLGAGASVGEKKYLSNEIIEYYQSYLGKDFNEKNIQTFLDILSADENFSRKHFDSFVVSILQKLQVTEAHKILASIPWREIITTNYDLLVERAYDEISNTASKVYDLKVVRNLKQLTYKESNTEVKYIKLNGCMQDISLYPLAFSSDDFEKAKPFYRNVLNELKNLSPDILFLAIGYSFSDAFGKQLLDKLDAFNYREKKWMICVDPFPNENALPYYTKNKTCIVKCSFADFFARYKEWENKQEEILIKKKGLSITDSKNQYITLPHKLLLNIEGIIKQLNVANSSREKFVKDEEFYRGDEPNFNIITRSVDVVKNKQIENCIKIIKEDIQARSTFLPVFFITGEFGIGKSTFTLRLIHELQKDDNFDLVSFEIVDFNRVSKNNIIDLVNGCKAKHLLFFCDEVEVESYFKSLLDLQRDLSIEQFQDCNIFFVVPIRENILEKFKLTRTIPKSKCIKLDAFFSDSELDELLSKLKKSGLVDYRDAASKKEMIEIIKRDYHSDAFISLMTIITSGKHENDLIDSYNQLSPDAQKAFLYTALLHRHKLWMPASWLKQNISMDWDEFTQKIIKAEGKGILIQDTISARGAQPDLYFRTKHPIIAAKLVDRILPNKDRQFLFYDKMLKTIEPGQTSSYLANNLLKAFIRNEEYNHIQLNSLFDSGYSKLSDDPFFILNYATNLQYRNTISDCKRALELLVYAESLLERRNSKFIHRRGVVSFEIAKLYYQDDNKLSLMSYYLKEAKDLFQTKQLLDPFSSYSYSDYISLLIWELNNIHHEEEDEIQKQIVIEELFDLASRTVVDGFERIDAIRSKYANYLSEFSDNKTHKEYLDEMYADFRLKPYACILLYNYYNQKEEFGKCFELVEEMEYYQQNYEVTKFLFKHYGRNLEDPNIRIKFLKLSHNNQHIEKESPLRYNYFNFIAETYNFHFNEGRTYLENIRTKFYNINPEYDIVWKHSDGNEWVFDGKIIKKTGERFKAVKIPALQQTVRLMKGEYDKYPLGCDVTVVLHFYLYGLIAEIVEVEE
jgi:hypothetical protein